jgi:CheY-like chemotaxis protein
MSLRQHKVLGVDDCRDDLFLLQRALAQTESLALVACVRNGLEAISYLQGQAQFSDRENYPLPELLLLDLKMPGLDGFGVLEWLQGHPVENCRTVVFTGSIDEGDRHRALALGAHAVCIKPVKPSDYLQFAKELERSLFGLRAKAVCNVPQ